MGKVPLPRPRCHSNVRRVWPQAMYAEEAGGEAVDDHGRILDKVPSSLHERSPYYVGTRHLVAALEACRCAPADAFVAHGPQGAETRESVP
ncbi:MAG: hypothetical protein VX101_00715 [Bacteroidota bacterium]|nr:hypothetical protein [Bacteroidota bacterium]